MKRLLSIITFLSIILACIGADEDSHGIFQAIRENDKAKVKELAGTAQLKAIEGERRFSPLMTALAE